MKLAMFAEKMLPAQDIRWKIPDTHLLFLSYDPRLKELFIQPVQKP